MTEANSPLHLVDVLEEHAEECAFAWQQRDAALFAPDFDLPDLLEWDERLEAHVEGLLIGADVGLEMAMGLDGDDPGTWFAQGRLLIARGDVARFSDLVMASSYDPLTARAVCSSLGFAAPTELKGIVQQLLNSTEPRLQWAGIAGCAMHRVNPGEILKLAITSTDAALAARAIKCAGELGRAEYLSAIEGRLSDQEPTVRFSAAKASLLFGSTAGLKTLTDVASREGPYQREAMMLYVAVAPDDDVSAWLAQLANHQETARFAMMGAGLTGDPRYLPALLDRMQLPELARVAGEAFEWITGLYIFEASLELLDEVEVPDIEALEREAERDGEDEYGDEEDRLHVDDRELVVPDMEKMLPWWEANKQRFAQDTRYFCGLTAGTEADSMLLRTGRQRYRHQAAINLALRSPSAQLFDVRAPARLQWRALAANS